MSFSHLHVHTVYSVFDGMAGIEELFARAERLGMPGLAITDHGTMSGAAEFFSVARKHPSVKPVIGCEVYVTRHDHRIHPKEHGSSHLILLARNLTGYRNLLKIVSEANTVGMNVKPCVSYDYIFAHAEGIIALSACIGGDIPKSILAGDMTRAALLAQKMKKAFGEDFYLEVSEHESRKDDYESDLLDKQRIVTEGLYLLSSQLGIKVVATNDVHFCLAEDARAHDALLCASTGHTMDDEDRFIYTGQEYLKSEEEMRAVFPNHPDAIDNTLEVVSKVETFDIFSRPSVPDFPLPKGSASPMEYLSGLAVDGLNRRGLAGSLEARARLQRELEAFHNMDFEMGGAYANHMLILWDLLREMRLRGIAVGPGRGSSAGSLLNYVLDITDVNPLEHGLLFERFFVNGKALGIVPDIDLDLGADGILTAYRYLQDKYGYEHVSRVVCFGRRSPRIAVRDAFAAFGLDPVPVLRALTDRWPANVDMMEILDMVQTLGQWYRNAGEREREAYRAAARMSGTIKETGIHACAVLLSREPLTDFVPLKVIDSPFGDDQLVISQYDGHWVEVCGPAKMDFLQLETLDILDDSSRGMEIPFTLDDPDTLRLFAAGDTQGIFQFESRGMREYLRGMKPDRFEDLVLLNATYRPGPMEWIPELVRRKLSGQIRVAIPGTEEILSDSYGIPVYQEQVMEIAKKVAGFSPDRADCLRKALGKLMRPKLDEMMKEFIEGGIARGYDSELLQDFWNDLERNGQYMFCKSHSICYTMVAFRCAWLKAHSFAAFYAAIFEAERWSRQELAEDMRQHGVTLLPPDINRSCRRCSALDESTVILGLGDISDVSPAIIDEIIEKRRHGRPFTDIRDFAVRVDCTDLWSVEKLAGSGALDCLGVDRGRYFSGNPFWRDVASVMSFHADLDEIADEPSKRVKLARELRIPARTEVTEDYLEELQEKYLDIRLPKTK